MTPRERVLTVLNRRQPDRVPKAASFTEHVMNVFREKTGCSNPAVYFGMEPRYVGFRPTKQAPDWSVWHGDLPPNASVDEWGTARIRGDFYHFTSRQYPLRDATDLRVLDEYPWPDITAEYRHEHLEEAVRALQERGFPVFGSVGHIWETAWQIRGMDRLMMDFIDAPEFAARLLDEITDRRCFMARRYAEAGVDCLHLGDDIGMQDRLMMSPDMWRHWLKPRLARVIAAGRRVRPDLHVFYHSDGDIRPVLPDLIEVGVTVLNPVQPECMNPMELKRKYGDRLAFWGTIGTQTTMPYGTPDEVRRTVRERIETVGRGGGLLLAPTHVLEPDVPWENIVAFFEAVELYGRY